MAIIKKTRTVFLSWLTLLLNHLYHFFSMHHHHSPSSSMTSFFTIIVIAFSMNSKPTISCFTSIINFGDSLSDTGNYLISNAKQQGTNVGRFPYGETYFHHPTGRFSDGRIMLDLIAEAMGLPLVPPSLGGTAGRRFQHGVNFAVGGATAIESRFFWKRGIKLSTNYSLDVQLAWFRYLLPSLCPYNCTDCSEFLSNSLFFLGEIGGNDYNGPFAHGKKLDEVKNYVPRVINAISSAIVELIEHGAKTLVVPGYLPVGCLSFFLTIFQNSEKEEQTGCVKWLNKFAKYHDRMLLKELHRIRQHHPSVTIIFADYYNATMNIYRHPRHFGFGDDHLSACCGGGGPYNYNNSAECGTGREKICSDPSRFICWDGMHLTEAAYKAIASQLIHGPLAIAPISNACQMKAL